METYGKIVTSLYFQDSKLPIEEHYSKKGVHPVEVYDILPDDEMWKYPCAQVFPSYDTWHFSRLLKVSIVTFN